MLVRLHPRDEVDAYREFANTPHVIIEKPFRDTVKVADGLAIDVMPEHQKHLGDTLCHADVVVNVASTITIEACIFDTPVVNIYFDGPGREPVREVGAPLLLVHALREHHLARRRAGGDVARGDGARRGRVSGGSARWTPPGRKQVVLDQCQFTDGRSAERVVRLVLDELGAAAARAAA